MSEKEGWGGNLQQDTHPKPLGVVKEENREEWKEAPREGQPALTEIKERGRQPGELEEAC